MLEIPVLLSIMRRFPALVPKEDYGFSRSVWEGKCCWLRSRHR
jgi:hypothetical protein